LEVYSGGRLISIRRARAWPGRTQAQAATAFVDRLRGFGNRHPQGRLQKTVLPRQLVRELRGIATAVDRSGVRAAADELGFEPGSIRFLLPFARALAGLDRIGTIRCNREQGPHPAPPPGPGKGPLPPHVPQLEPYISAAR
jgi:hypothetical protein